MASEVGAVGGYVSLYMYAWWVDGAGVGIDL